jgi:putative ABC transport system permease protein
MLVNYFKTAVRNLFRNKLNSIINITGLSVGMAVAALTGLWIWDELTFNQYHTSYDRVARVMENRNWSGPIGTLSTTPPPTANELRSAYGDDLKHVVMSSLPQNDIISFGEKNLLRRGYFMEPGGADMLSLRMIKGTRAGLQDAGAMFLSESLATALFGTTDPTGKIIRIDNQFSAKVAGVYEDIPRNSDFSDMNFVGAWKLYESNNSWIRKDSWEQNGFQTYVQIADNADMQKVSEKIKTLRLKNVDAEQAKAQPENFLFPMNKWHLYGDFENGKSVGGNIRHVRLYGTIGLFVLLLACINFMNLATARSEKNAKEVGIRKTVGSLRSQLLSRFFVEAVLIALLSFLCSLIIISAILPFFNELTGKEMFIPWLQPLFWTAGIGFSIITGLIAGSYPAWYLSSFQPVKVLKGTFKAGRLAAIPRKALVVLQFSVSIALIVGVMVVYLQVQTGRTRAAGYDRERLVMLYTPTNEIHDHIDAVRNEIIQSNAATQVAESLNKLTGISFTINELDWDGSGARSDISFGSVNVSPEFGKTIGWKIIRGRDFLSTPGADSLAVIINETAAKLMRLEKPEGTIVKHTAFGKTETYTVVGVIEDMLMESPYESVRPTFYLANRDKGNYLNLRLNAQMSTATALEKIETIIKKYSPGTPFQYQFTDDEYATKFVSEERTARLSGFFALLAIVISCMGIFGLASFMAGQRTKEIGVRKVLGASVFTCWRLLSKDFFWLVIIAFLVAAPLGGYFMSNWLENYQYRTNIPWWVFAAAGLGTMFITLLTVSFQSVKAAMMNPVKSLRTE